MLSRCRIRTRFFKHDLHKGDLPNPLPAEELAKLVQRLRAGDKTTVELIAKSHIRLVLTIAGRYLHRYMSRKDDIVSVGLEAMMEAINKADHLRDDNITPYIVSYVHGFISDYIKSDTLIPVPPRTVRYKAQGMSKTEYTALHIFPIVKSFHAQFREHDESEPADIALISYDEHDVELRDLIESLHLTERQTVILELRMQSHTLKEIGEFFKRTEAWACIELKKIQEKVGRVVSLLKDSHSRSGAISSHTSSGDSDE